VAPAAPTRAVATAAGALLPLAFAREELRRIGGVVGSARLFEREAAVERALARPEGARATMLHFATHAVVDETRPEQSAWALTPLPPSEDGLLQVREIYRLSLDADLVTLSACETALGAEFAGEGLVGLARAFHIAGARAVVATLWSVNDEATAELMDRFY